MIAGTSNVLAWYHAQRRPFWKLSDRSGMVADHWNTSEGHPMPPADAEDALKNALALLAPGRYMLETAYSADSTGTKTRAKTAIDVEATPGTPVANPVAGMVTNEEIDRRIESALTAYQTKVELDRLRAENAELQKQVREPGPMELAWAGLIEKSTPFAGPVIGKMLKDHAGQIVDAAHVGSTDPAESTEAPDSGDVQQRATAAFNKLQSMDPKLVERLERLAAMDQNEYNALTGMLD